VSPTAPSREDVLDAFAVEATPDRDTLERYLTTYPQFARDLIDLSRELARTPSDIELSAADCARIDTAWQQHIVAVGVVDPFAHLSTQDLRDLAHRLAVPRQVITAFREHRVLLTTVPGRFLGQLAEALHRTVDVLRNAQPRIGAAANSYKADHKPATETAIAFERVLIDAGVDAARRAELLADDT
jgi:hypothetical protein